MQPQFELVRLFVNIAYLAGNCWLVWLACFALARTRLWFFWLLIFSWSFSVLYSLINLLLVLNTRAVVNYLGEQRFTLFYNIYLALQLLNFVPFITGFTYLVFHICRRKRKRRRIE